LVPAAAVLESLLCDSANSTDTSAASSPPRILIHAFSNGGSYQLVTLGQLLAKRSVIPSRRTTTGIVIDSSPGRGNLTNAIQAFTAAVPNRLYRLLIGMLVSALYAYFSLRYILFGTNPPADILKESLLNAHLVPWVDERTPRLYVYSKVDQLIPWQDVEGHIHAVEAAGMDVRSEVFEKSAHVQHAIEDPKRYWSAIAGLWDAVARAYGGQTSQ